jgi:aminoglycoside phosphotransferase (APT) family kinase protein
VDGLAEPIIASRSESAILRDMVETPREVTRASEQFQLLADILDTVHDIDPMLRRIVQQQANWDLDKLERQIVSTIGDTE